MKKPCAWCAFILCNLIGAGCAPVEHRNDGKEGEPKRTIYDRESHFEEAVTIEIGDMSNSPFEMIDFDRLEFRRGRIEGKLFIANSENGPKITNSEIRAGYEVRVPNSDNFLQVDIFATHPTDCSESPETLGTSISSDSPIPTGEITLLQSVVSTTCPYLIFAQGTTIGTNLVQGWYILARTVAFAGPISENEVILTVDRDIEYVRDCPPDANDCNGYARWDLETVTATVKLPFELK